MTAFLRENWLFIVIPIGVVFLGLTALVLLGDDSSSNFIYNIF